uniref:Uncharacterized protein n=1 Tax=Arion vulgaris TaxID=1028688 RepID=A0A0B7B606_9EUPU
MRQHYLKAVISVKNMFIFFDEANNTFHCLVIKMHFQKKTPMTMSSTYQASYFMLLKHTVIAVLYQTQMLEDIQIQRALCLIEFH